MIDAKLKCIFWIYRVIYNLISTNVKKAKTPLLLLAASSPANRVCVHFYFRKRNALALKVTLCRVIHYSANDPLVESLHLAFPIKWNEWRQINPQKPHQTFVPSRPFTVCPSSLLELFWIIISIISDYWLCWLWLFWAVEGRGNGLEGQEEELFPRQWSDKGGLNLGQDISWVNVSGKYLLSSHEDKGEAEGSAFRLLLLWLYNKGSPDIRGIAFCVWTKGLARTVIQNLGKNRLPWIAAVFQKGPFNYTKH